jgi:hypothetical protein
MTNKIEPTKKMTFWNGSRKQPNGTCGQHDTELNYTCSLEPGHLGPHRAYPSHDLLMDECEGAEW